MFRGGKMTEIKSSVKTFMVSKLCDKCEDGTMSPTGIMLTSNPPQYPHKCKTCGAVANLQERYPKIVYERADET